MKPRSRRSRIPDVLQPLYTDWLITYGDLVDSDRSVECVHCNSVVYGDGDPAPITCWLCFVAERSPQPSDDPLEG